MPADDDDFAVQRALEVEAEEVQAGDGQIFVVGLLAIEEVSFQLAAPSILSCSDEELWRRLKLSFACVCAPTERLCHTVAAWALEVESLVPELRRHLCPCVEWLTQADIVTWLVPDSESPSCVVRRENALLFAHGVFRRARSWQTARVHGRTFL